MFEYRSSLDKIKLKMQVRTRRHLYGIMKGQRPHLEYIFEFAMKRDYYYDGYDIPMYKARKGSCLRNRVYHKRLGGGSYDKDTSLYVGYDYSPSLNVIRQDTIVVEFNPNKSLDMFNNMMEYFDCVDSEVLSYDVAFDFDGLDRFNVMVFGKYDLMTIGDNSTNTLYVSPKEKASGRIKVYQKDVERHKKGVNIEKTLRIECSFKRKYDAADIVNRLSSLYYHHETERRVSMNAMEFLFLNAPPSLRKQALTLMGSQARAKYNKLSWQQGATPLFRTLGADELNETIQRLLAPYIFNHYEYDVFACDTLPPYVDRDGVVADYI